MKINLITEFEFYNLGILKNIIYYHDLKSLIGVKFIFNKKNLLISITNEDELELFIDNNQEIIDNKENLSEDLMRLNNSLIFKNILWVWELINQRGYSDGFQFEFMKKDHQERVVVQFIAIANSIKIYILKEVI